MCVVTSNPINFTACNDANYWTLQEFTEGLRQQGAPVVPRGQQLSWQSSSLESIMHLIDAAISFLMGVVSALADLVQSLDMAHCKMPDYFLNETVFCACNDTAFGIPPSRAQEGLAGVGLWCTGTLSLLDASNQPFVVYNPYTYAQLQALAAGSDAYLACMSSKTYLPGETDCNPPTDNGPLQAQGVNVLTVLTACKANYLDTQGKSAGTEGAAAGLFPPCRRTAASDSCWGSSC